MLMSLSLLIILLCFLMCTCSCFQSAPQSCKSVTALYSNAGFHDLWVVGAGTLGGYVTQILSQLKPGSSIIAETASTRKHSELAKFAAPRVRSSRTEADARTAMKVLISITPSTSEYVKEVSEAVELVSDSGNLLLVSSTAVYGNAVGTIDEDSPVDASSPRAAPLLAAERAVLDRGGNVVRFPGLYDAGKGPHTYWRRLAEEGREIDSDGESLLNMLHYEDAARLCLAILNSDYRGTVFMGSDGSPISRQDICKYSFGEDTPLPKFVGKEGVTPDKIVDDSRSRETLGWTPRYTSLGKYFREREVPIVDLLGDRTHF